LKYNFSLFLTFYHVNKFFKKQKITKNNKTLKIHIKIYKNYQKIDKNLQNQKTTKKIFQDLASAIFQILEPFPKITSFG